MPMEEAARAAAERHLRRLAIGRAMAALPAVAVGFVEAFLGAAQR